MGWWDSLNTMLKHHSSYIPGDAATILKPSLNSEFNTLGNQPSNNHESSLAVIVGCLQIQLV